MFGLIEDKKYNVWYVTPKRATKKRKSFDTIEEAKKWCKSNKNRLTLIQGSWEILSYMKEIKKVKQVECNDSDLVWSFGK